MQAKPTEIKPVNAEFSVAGQIAPADIAGIKAQGFQTIICNRPDGETWGQPDFDGIATAARLAGMQVAHLPISGGVGGADVIAFNNMLRDMPAPVLAYCRSGMRCMTLWACTQARDGVAIDDILTQAEAAGYDLSQVAGVVLGFND